MVDSLEELYPQMEQLTLLLKCPLCSKPLDASAKVLPCQHTFCLSCLQAEEESGPEQLLCPECYSPVPTLTVEELPENLLLVRLLEELQGPKNTVRNSQNAAHTRSCYRSNVTVPEDLSETAPRNLVHNHQAYESAELGVNSARYTNSNHKADDSWHCEDTSERSTNKPLCRTLCDFDSEEINEEESKYCLSFRKGDILTVIRQVDEHWIEAKQGEKVGFCLLQFVEPNSAAAKLLQAKTRRGVDSAEAHHQPESRGKDNAHDATNRSSHHGLPQEHGRTLTVNPLVVYTYWKQPPTASNSHQTTTNNSSSNRRGQSQRFLLPPTKHTHTRHSRGNSRRISQHTGSHRHHSQSAKKMTSETPPTITMALLNPQVPSASADGKTSSTQQLSISVCAVLYSYKPRRPEELELRKGEMVGVYGKFTEGWLRGLSLRTGKVGILPGNYITPVLRTSARLLETKAAHASSQYNTGTGKKPATVNDPTGVRALDKVNGDGGHFSMGHMSFTPNGVQHSKPSFYGSSQGWDTVRRIFNPRRSENNSTQLPSLNVPPNMQHFAQVQASGYSPALQRKKNNTINSKLPSWMTEPLTPSSVSVQKDRDLNPYEPPFHQYRQPSAAPQSILVKPDTHRNNSTKPHKTVRFVADEDSPLPRHRTSSWSSGTHITSSSGRSGPPLLEVWAPSLTMGRDGPGIVLKDRKSPILRRGNETSISDPNIKPLPSQSPFSALTGQFSQGR